MSLKKKQAQSWNCQIEMNRSVNTLVDTFQCVHGYGL